MCKHSKLVKQEGPMDGGIESKRYRCEICNEFFMVELHSAEITSSLGKRDASEADKGGAD